MHPDNMPLRRYNPGQLFLKMPDGSHAELKYKTAQVTPQEEPAPYYEPGTPYITTALQLPEISIELEPCPEFDAWLHGMVQSYNAWLQQKVNEYIQDMVHWAMENRPKWYQIMRRTKKGRTRKKYAQRILRAYREERKSNGKESKK